MFSSPTSLISLSEDKSVKFWQVGVLQTDPIVNDPECIPLLSGKIVSITVQAEEGVVISSDAEGVVKTWDISTSFCKTSLQTPADGSQCSDVQLTNSRLFSVWYLDGKIHMWGVEKGELLQTLGVTLDYYNDVQDVRMPRDGSKKLFLCWRVIQTRSVPTGEVMGEVGLKPCLGPSTLSVDGSSVWVHSPISEPLGWDFGIPGSPSIQLPNLPSLHPNKTKLWDIHQSRITDTVTGKVVFQLVGRLVEHTYLWWDGQHLVTGYESGEVLILDFNYMFL